jgi:hypothetical protein
VICGEVLNKESLKQNERERHLEAKHSTFVGKDRSLFENESLKQNKLRRHLEGNKALSLAKTGASLKGEKKK